MTFGTLLAVIGVVLAIASVFVTKHAHRLLVAAVVLIGLGVLLSHGKFVTV